MDGKATNKENFHHSRFRRRFRTITLSFVRSFIRHSEKDATTYLK